jgi:LysR family transcriptional regulator, mexEF-oprN operon transcriptional activator
MKTINLHDISRFDFNLLVAFLAIWEERSVSRAAVRLSLSQSAVSAALTRLRDAAGDPLFIRTRGGMQPTPRAMEMAERLEQGAGLIHGAFTASASFDPATSVQQFSLGMSDDFELAIGPVISQRLLAETPQVSVIFRQTNRYTMEAMLDARDIDIAVVARPNSRSWLAQEDIGESGYACLFDAALCGVNPPLPLADFLALPHVLVSFSGREGIVDQVLHGQGKSRRIHTALTHFSALPAFLKRIPAVSTLPRHAAAVLAESTGLALSPAPIALPRYPVSMVWRRDMASDPASHWMRRLVSDAMARGAMANNLMEARPIPPLPGPAPDFSGK